MTAHGDDHLITHHAKSELNLAETTNRLQSSENLTLPLAEELQILHLLSEFDLGKFLLKNHGLSGYWTSYIILHAPKVDLKNPVEAWIIHKAPAVKATRERFWIFQKQLQKHVKNNAVMASIPCGTMDDLLLLDYSNTKNTKLIGIDLDEESLKFAEDNAKKQNKSQMSSFAKKDAWNLEITEKYNVITSNGLNIYEPDNDKVIALFKEFYNALTPGGIFVTSFLTPPQVLDKNSPWQNVVAEDAKKQKAIFSDILQAKWQSFATEEQTKKQLQEAGFEVLEVIYDSQKMFPTIVAKKKV